MTMFRNILQRGAKLNTKCVCTEQVCGFTQWHYESVDSTINVAANILDAFTTMNGDYSPFQLSCNSFENNRLDRLIISAGQQTKGRGSGIHEWNSETYNNIYMSCILNLQKYCSVINMQMEIGLVLGVSVFLTTQHLCLKYAEFAEKHNLTEILQVQYKWPNDIMLNGKKICGMLTEITSRSDNINIKSESAKTMKDTQYAFLSVGFNVKRVSLDIATSLENWHININTNDFISLFCIYLNDVLKLWTDNGFVFLLNIANKNLYRENYIVSTSNSSTIIVRPMRILENYNLLAMKENGTEIIIDRK
jgi:biotin-(acetyl-CoA carboxylase) ligase